MNGDNVTRLPSGGAEGACRRLPTEPHPDAVKVCTCGFRDPAWAESNRRVIEATGMTEEQIRVALDGDQ